MLSKSVSQRDATYHFIKSSKVLMTRNASELEKIRDLFHKYGYQSPVGRDEGNISPFLKDLGQLLDVFHLHWHGQF